MSVYIRLNTCLSCSAGLFSTDASSDTSFRSWRVRCTTGLQGRTLYTDQYASSVRRSFLSSISELRFDRPRVRLLAAGALLGGAAWAAPLPAPGGLHDFQACPELRAGDSPPPCGRGGASGGAPPFTNLDPARTFVRSLDQEPFLHADVGAHGVVLSSGEFVHQVTDLSLKGRGFDLDLVRTYRSRSRIRTVMGQGWNFSYNERMVERPSGVVEWIRGESWSEVFVPHAGGAGFVSTFGYQGALRRHGDGGFQRRDAAGMVWTYGAAGQLGSINDRNGNVMAFLHQGGRLQGIIDTMGRRLSFFYDEDTGLLQAVQDHGGRRVEYTYDVDGRLVAVRQPGIVLREGDAARTIATAYTYLEAGTGPLAGNLEGMWNGRGQQVLALAYGDGGSALDRVTSLTQGEPGTSGTPVLLFQYDSLDGPGAERGRTRLTGPRGEAGERFYDAGGRLLRQEELGGGWSDPAAPRAVTEFIYGPSSGRLFVVRHPEGNETHHHYDGGGGPVQLADGSLELREGLQDRYRSGNVVATTRLAGPRGDGLGGVAPARSTSSEYEPLFNQVMAQVDAAGARWIRRFDYEELSCAGPVWNTLAAMAAAWWVSVPAGVSFCGAGDLNGDGVTAAGQGNVVLQEMPAITRAGVLELEPSVWKFHYNHLGQRTRVIGPGGQVTVFDHRPETMPHNDTEATNPTPGRILDPETGGYLRRMVEDAVDAASGRPAGTVPAPLGLVHDYEHDTWGNQVKGTDPRGIESRAVVNQLGLPLRLEPYAAVAPEPRGESGLQPLPWVERLVYDEDLNLTERHLPGAGTGDVQVTRQVFDVLGRMVEQRLEDGAGTVLAVSLAAHDAAGNLERQISPAGRVVRREYDLLGRPSRVTHFANLTARPLPGVVPPGDPVGDAVHDKVVRFTHDLNGNRVAEEHRDIRSAGSPPAWREMRTGFNGFDEPAWTRDASCTRAESVRDDRGLVLEEEVRGSAGGPSLDAAASCPASLPLLARRRRVHDEAGRLQRLETEHFDLDTANPSTVLLRAGGPAAQENYHDARGLLARQVASGGRETLFSYDGAGRLTSTRTPLVEAPDSPGTFVPVRLETLDRDASGNVVVTTVEEFETGGEARQVRSFTPRDAAGKVPVTTLQGDGGLAAETVMAYDRRGRLVQTRHPDGAVEILSYDPLDRLLARHLDLTDAAGELEITSANPDGRISVLLERDADGLILARTDDRGEVTSLAYDGGGRLISQSLADGTLWCHQLSPSGALLRLAVRQGGTCDADAGELMTHLLTRDAGGRLISRDTWAAPESGVLAASVQHFEFDGLGRLTRATDDNAGLGGLSTVRRTHDSLGNITLDEQIYRGKVSAVRSRHDATGLRTLLEYPGLPGTAAMQVSAVADAAGRLLALSGPGFQVQVTPTGAASFSRRVLTLAGGLTLSRSIERDGLGRIAGADDTLLTPAGSLPVAGFSRGLDAAGRPLHEFFTHLQAPGGALGRTFVSDAAGRLRQVRQGGVAFTAAPAGEVAEIASPQRQWEMLLDGTDNIVEDRDGLLVRRHLPGALGFLGRSGMTADYAGLGWQGGRTRTADLLGSLRREEEEGQAVLYHHDTLGRLVRIDKEDGAGLLRVADFAYDALGRRLETDINGGQRRVWVYDGRRVIQELGYSSAWRQALSFLGPDRVVARDIHGDGLDEVLLAWRDLDGLAAGAADGTLETTLVPLTDLRGSTERVLDHTGAVLESYTYTPLGERTVLRQGVPYPATAHDYHLGFTGHRVEIFPAINRQILQARHRQYDPTLGRFLERDPLGFAGGDALYAYAGAQPAAATDPLGLVSIAGPGSVPAIHRWGENVTAAGLSRCRNCLAQAAAGAAAVLAGVTDGRRLQEDLWLQFPLAISIHPLQPSWWTGAHPSLTDLAFYQVMQSVGTAKAMSERLLFKLFKREQKYRCPCLEPMPTPPWFFIADAIIESSPRRVDAYWSANLQGTPIALEGRSGIAYFVHGPSLGAFIEAGSFALAMGTRLVTRETESGHSFSEGTARVGASINLGTWGRVGFNLFNRTQVLAVDGRSLKLPYIIDENLGLFWEPGSGAMVNNGRTAFGIAIPPPPFSWFGYYVGNEAPAP